MILTLEGPLIYLGLITAFVLIDLLIATDCISEGQNLQDADLLINFDIHWNPVRLIQRFGRIDRIGSLHDSIKMVNFWPTPDLNHYINLKGRVEARMALVDLSATGEDNILADAKNAAEADLKWRDKQLLRLKDEVFDLEDEILREDAVRMEALAREAGVPVRLEIYPRMWHVWQLNTDMPDAARSLDDIAAFLSGHLEPRASST